MHRILAIAKREYVARFRTKAFLIGTIMTPVLMVAWIAAPQYFDSRARAHEVLVLDQSGDPGLFGALERRLERANLDRGRGGQARPLTALFRLEHRPLGPEEDLAAVRQRLLAEHHAGDRERVLLLLGPGVLRDRDPEYHGTT